MVGYFLRFRFNFVDNDAIRNTRCAHEGNNFFWFRGGRNLSLVDLNSFETKDMDFLRGKRMDIHGLIFRGNFRLLSGHQLGTVKNPCSQR